MFIFTTHKELWARELMDRIMGCDRSLGLKEFLNQPKFAPYLHMFIFATYQELWTCDLMGRIRGCDHSQGRKDILKFIYYFMILFLIVYIFKYFFIVSTI
jgi:hypothetical protein